MRLDPNNERVRMSSIDNPCVIGLKTMMLTIRTLESKVEALGNELSRLKQFPCRKFFNKIIQSAEVLLNIGNEIHSQVDKLKEEDEDMPIPDWARMREEELAKCEAACDHVRSIIHALQ